MPVRLTIEPLAQHPHWVGDVARGINDERWTQVADASVDTIAACLRANLDRAPMPVTLVALSEDRAVGAWGGGSLSAPRTPW